MGKYTKSELLDELREVVYQYARGASFVFGQRSGYTLLFGTDGERTDGEEVSRFISPDDDSKTFGRPFDLDGFPVTESVKQFYDYGLRGVRTVHPSWVTGATEWSFAYGFLCDASQSLLLSEICNGERVVAEKCLHAARAFFARLVLDGAERVRMDEDAPPDDMLSIAEVAALADLDERTVRNAMSKGAVNRLESTVVESSVYIGREAARTWLAGKRGFVPTRIGDELPANQVLDEGFVSVEEAGEFVRRIREQQGSDSAGLAAKSGPNITAAEIEALEQGRVLLDEARLSALGKALGFNERLFALRWLEVAKKQELQALQRSILGVANLT